MDALLTLPFLAVVGLALPLLAVVCHLAYDLAAAWLGRRLAARDLADPEP